MSLLMMLAASGGIATTTLQTRTLTANGTFTVPFGVSQVSLSGKGAAGSPSGYSGDVSQSATVDEIINTTGSGGPNSGGYTWGDFSQDAINAANQINQGGSGTFYGVNYFGTISDNTYRVTLNGPMSYTNAIPGSAVATFAANYGTGSLPPNVSSRNGVQWREYGTNTAATNGAPTTGFGKTFPGGFGGAASVTTFNDVAVTPGASYSIVVPAGGSITITYYG